MKRTPRHCFLYFSLCVMLSLSIVCRGVGQNREATSTLGLPDYSLLKSARQPAIPTTTSRTPVPIDARVNPSEYYVGPGDELALHIWSSAPVERVLTITPEGSVLIPNVGPVSLAGLTLEQAKSAVAKAIAERYVNAPSSLTLLTPRMITVQIAGMVLNEGRKEAYAVQRVDDVISKANEFPVGQMSVDQYGKELNRLNKEASERNIMVRSHDGKVHRVDLTKYRSTGNGIYNPYVREGDVIYVPGRSDQDNTIGIFGALASVANYEFVPGDSLTDLVQMGFGLKEQVDSSSAILTRLSADGRVMDTLHVDLRGILRRTSPNIALQPGDRLIVTNSSDMRRNYRVSIQGEVARPGTYPITLNGTRLSAAIKEAGGFTENANLHAATIMRSDGGFQTSQEEQEQELLLSRRTTLPEADSSYYNAETALRLKGEAVAVDFERLFARGDSTQDVILHAYDRVLIPSREHTVYVFGQVTKPSHVHLLEGKDVDYYIASAGGYTDDARTGDTKVIKAGSRVWLDPGETLIEDGDMIWVPKEVHYPLSHYISTYAQIASIIGVAATVAILVKSLQ